MSKRNPLHSQVSKVFSKHYKRLKDQTAAHNATLEEMAGPYNRNESEAEYDHRHKVSDALRGIKPRNRPVHDYRIQSLDVWGNAKEGYEVNQSFNTNRYVELPEHPDNDDIIKALQKAGEIKKGVRRNLFEVDGESAYTLYISYKGRPEMHLERVKEGE